MCDGFLMKLVVPFVLRNSSGHVDVEIRASLGSADSGGIFLDSTLPPNAGAGLPICTANIVYEASGYAAAMGWVQLVHSSDSGHPDRFELDPLALLRNANTPYAFFGIKPQLFDAPQRDSHAELTWQARSYLAVTSDAVISAEALPVAGFSWGFGISRAGITIEPPALLDIASWADHVGLLESEHPGWRFTSGQRVSKPGKIDRPHP